MRIRTNDSYGMFEKAMNKAGYAGLSDFARAIGEPKSSLSRYFNLQRQMPADTLCKVATGLKLTPTKLLASMGYKVRKK
jgi:hypothetical protein